MTVLFQFIAGLALVAIVTGIFSLWSGLFDNRGTAGLLFGGLAILIAFLFDRLKARSDRKGQEVMPPRD